MGRSPDDGFGAALDLSADGTTLLVGPTGECSSANGINSNVNLDDAFHAGAAYPFKRDTTWSQFAYLKASNSDVDDYFGRSVSLSADGTFIAIGAHGEGSSTNVDPTSSTEDARFAGAA